LLLVVGLVVLLAGVPAKAAQVTLAWDRNTESNIAGYRIYYGTGSRAYNWFIDVGNVLTHTVSGLTDGSTYYFAAKAYNTSNVESAYSAEVSYRACTYSISPTAASIGQQGASGTLQVTTQAGCSWTAGSGASWFTITSGYQGTGNGTVAYAVTSNTGASPRTVASTIARKLFTVTQAGTSSTYTSPSGASSLSVQMAQPSASASLSTEGTRDWAHWGLTATSSFNHKSGVTQQIRNYTLIGSTSPSRFSDGRVAYSWSRGTPTASATSSKTGIYFRGIGKGYRLTIPAQKTQSVLKIYLGLWRARGRFEAKLSDGSVTPYVTYLDNSTGSLDRAVTLRFSSASSNVNLVVEYTVENNYGNSSGNITLQAATLAVSLP